MSKGLMLIAEDNPALLQLYTAAFKGAGYTVLGVVNGKEALDMLPRVQPRILVLDVTMPDVSGIEVCKGARRLLGPNLPVLFLTANQSMDTLQACVEAGGNDFLIKSDNIASILARVDFWATKGVGPNVRDKSEILQDIKAAEPIKADAELGFPRDPDDRRQWARALFLKARNTAHTDYGRSRHERAVLIGYVAGVLDAQAAEDFRLKPSFWDDLLEMLRPSGALEDSQFVLLLDEWHALTGDAAFIDGVKAGREDCAEALEAQGKPTTPMGLAMAMSAAPAS